MEKLQEFGKKQEDIKAQGKGLVYSQLGKYFLVNTIEAVVQCNKNFDVIGVFPNQHSVPGYDYRRISAVTHRDNRELDGYLWYTYEEFVLNHSNKLEEYEERNKYNGNS